MLNNKMPNNRIMHLYIIIISIIIILAIVGILMLKYSVEGEKKLPFVIQNLTTISTAQANYEQDEEGTWKAEIIQKNDVYFNIEKNFNYKKDEVIAKIVFNNFRISKKNEIGTTEIYRPSQIDNLYTYSEEYIITDKLEYMGSQFTDTKLLEINNQGGLISFSIITKDLGEYGLTKNEKLPSDGKLFKKVNINNDDLKMELNFDIIIKTASGNSFKAEIQLDLPTGDIVENGIDTVVDTELSDIVFKRI